MSLAAIADQVNKSSESVRQAEMIVFEKIHYLKARDAHVAGTEKMIPTLDLIRQEIQYGQGQDVLAGRLKGLFKKSDVSTLEELLQKTEAQLPVNDPTKSALLDALKKALEFFNLQLSGKNRLPGNNIWMLGWPT